MTWPHAGPDDASLEAAIAQPTPEGSARPTHAQQNDWFWRETRAAALLRETVRRSRHLDGPGMEMVANYLLIPYARSDQAVR